MSADTRERPTDRFGRIRGHFWAWRGERPFWGGMLTLLAGIPIMYIPYQNFTLGSLTIRLSTTAGAGSLIIGVLLIVLGLTMWFQPQSRVFAGVASILLALVSLVVSNFGAFLVGFLLGLIGGALSVSWVPDKSVTPGAARRERAAGGGADQSADAGTGTGTADGGPGEGRPVAGTASSAPTGDGKVNGGQGAG